VLEYLGENLDWSESLGSSTTIKGEVIHAGPQGDGPEAFRRRLQKDRSREWNPEPRSLQVCADLMASELGWDESQTQKVLEEVQMLYPASIKADATEVHV